mgnify:CR=1 FL=1
MANGDSQFQLVTFQLGEELYGVNIMDVNEIVRLQEIRFIPNAPYYVEGIINLRGDIIPIIDLHKRFRIQALSNAESDFDGGIIILNIDGYSSLSSNCLRSSYSQECVFVFPISVKNIYSVIFTYNVNGCNADG